MSYPAAAIRTAIGEVLTGTIGSVRTVAANEFASGAFEGQPAQSTKAQALQTSTARHRFDVQLGQLRNNPSTSVSAWGSRRISDLDITIRITSNVSTPAQASQRATDLAEIASDCETAIQALSRPGNLTQTSAAVATNIVGGCLVGPSGSGTPVIERAAEDYGEKQLVVTTITARAILSVTQAVA